MAEMQVLSYSRPTKTARAKVARRLALASFLIPVLVAGMVYIEWFLAWTSLGHPPRPSLDDPKSISGSNWMHDITTMAMVGWLPGPILGFCLSVWHIVANRLKTQRALIWIGLQTCLWAGAVALQVADPGSVMDWWMD